MDVVTLLDALTLYGYYGAATIGLLTVFSAWWLHCHPVTYLDYVEQERISMDLDYVWSLPAREPTR